MKFEIGKKIKFNEKKYNVIGIYEKYALVMDVSKPIIEEGGEILLLKEQPDNQVLVMTNEDQIKKILTKIFSEGKF